MIERHYDYTPYAYIYNKPVGFSDQFGLDTLLVDGQGRFVDEKIEGGDNDVLIKVMFPVIKFGRKNKEILSNSIFVIME